MKRFTVKKNEFLKSYSNNKQWFGVKSFLVYVIIYHLIKNNKKNNKESLPNGAFVG